MADGAQSAEMSRDSLMSLPEGVVDRKGVDPRCRCHQAVRDGDFYYHGDRLYCRVASIAQWTFDTPVSVETVKRLLSQCTEGTGIRYFAWGETEPVTCWSSSASWDSSVFHILFEGLSADNVERINPKAEEYWMVDSVVKFTSLVWDQTWRETVSCQTPIRYKQLEERLGVKFYCQLKCPGWSFGDQDVYSLQFPTYWLMR
ncbi:hypothetical protein CEP51_016689 [Fusarium floridanum]|uniref:Uncharacterized protein n=1 Tax=Fusarium floridanum TaxID=1325733 RepID=A0A428NI91_9HYPO|nr:hypothetical protein CEP51_016689 [Fusarium floridanum]